MRAKQLREVSGFTNAGVYDPSSIKGTHVIYTLHDINTPERYGLPKNPIIPPSYTYWKWLAKPIGLWMGLLGIAAIFFHRVSVGPRWPQPEEPPEEWRRYTGLYRSDNPWSATARIVLRKGRLALQWPAAASDEG